MTIQYIRQMIEKNHEGLYLVSRVIIGLLFFVHGMQKLFGVLGAKGAAAAFSLFWFAGLIEFVAGLAITLGLLTRLMVIVSAIEMLVAYFMAHFPQGWNPIANKGELALLYFAAFLIMLWKGGGKWSVEKKLLKKELF